MSEASDGAEQKRPLSIPEIYERDCPYYMAIGMTYEQYWFGDPLMVRAYYKAYKVRREREDEEAWLHGLYALNALNATVGNMFRKEGIAPATYPEEPFLLAKKREAERMRTEREKEQEAVWAKAWMTQFVDAGKRWKK